ncbi:MAG: hypothetical protein IJ764_01505 [Bacteroidales bacterium]|nr:hypothetical protein [Bacteroidales bacterium]
MKTNKSPLEVAVEQTVDVAGHFNRGLQAVKGEYHSKISVTDARRLTGSVDIDDATRMLFPDSNRWDYAIEYDDETYFVEFHPASTSNVAEVLDKILWIKRWLKTRAPKIQEVKARNGNAFYWIATGRVSILKGSRQYRQAATAGLLPQKRLVFG